MFGSAPHESYLFTIIGLLNLECNFWCLISELPAENNFCWTDFLTWDVMKELLLTDALSYKIQCLLKCHHLLYLLRTVTFLWTASFTVFVVCAHFKTFGEEKRRKADIHQGTDLMRLHRRFLLKSTDFMAWQVSQAYDDRHKWTRYL